MISHVVRASILAVVCVAALATESPARTPFDGAWSVLIVTTKGDCDRAYRYPVKIENGSVGYAGSASFTVSGTVNEIRATTGVSPLARPICDVRPSATRRPGAVSTMCLRSAFCGRRATDRRRDK